MHAASRHLSRASQPENTDDHSDKSILGVTKSRETKTVVTSNGVDGKQSEVFGLRKSGIVQTNEISVEITDAESPKENDFARKDLRDMV
jgi:hypothetical protein